METFLIKATQLILALSLLVVIHEFGHFLFARMFGVRVEKFYIFFNPIRSLFKWKPGRYVGGLNGKRYFSEDAKNEDEEEEACDLAYSRISDITEKIKEKEKENDRRSIFDRLKGKSPDVPYSPELQKLHEELKQAEEAYRAAAEIRGRRADAKYEEQKIQSRWKRFWNNTEYGIGWLPLGGYCRISGMIDESMDAEAMKQPAKPYEFRVKPAWQRLLIMIAGVLFNFLTAILIYAGIVYATGEQYVPFKEATMGMEYSGEARKAGFHNGDIPLFADGKALDNPAEARMLMAQAKEVTVLRGGKDTVNIQIPDKFIFNLDNEAKSDTAAVYFMAYRIPTVVTQIAPGEGAEKGGLKEGDQIIAIDSTATPTLTQFLTTLKGHENETVTLSVVRRTSKEKDSHDKLLNPDIPGDTLRLPVRLNDNSKMGIGIELNPASFFKSEEIHYSLLNSVPRGIEMGTDKLVAYAKSMKMVFTKEGAKSIGGFGSIGAIFPDKWDWIAFWNIAAFLSVALAFMNIIPIPGLDGGHVLFLLYEVIFRRKPSEKFLERAQMTGMILLLLLLLYANGMDIVRLFK